MAVLVPLGMEGQGLVHMAWHDQGVALYLEESVFWGHVRLF